MISPTFVELTLVMLDEDDSRRFESSLKMKDFEILTSFCCCVVCAALPQSTSQEKVNIRKSYRII